MWHRGGGSQNLSNGNWRKKAKTLQSRTMSGTTWISCGIISSDEWLALLSSSITLYLWQGFLPVLKMTQVVCGYFDERNYADRAVRNNKRKPNQWITDNASLTQHFSRLRSTRVKDVNRYPTGNSDHNLVNFFLA